MANTYTQIHIHVVCVVQNRKSLIKAIWKEELYRYVGGIIKNKGHKVLAINGVEDHIHILFGLRPFQSLSDLMREVKCSSSFWINERKFLPSRFSWQKGYAAFSYSKDQISRVINYISNQEAHHRKKSFGEEYKALLNEFEIDYDEKYIFNSIT